MEALVKIGGFQYLIKEGEELIVPRREEGVGEKIRISDVLLLKTANRTLIGRPRVKGVWVEAEIKKHFKGEKVIVYKYIRRKNYRRKKGHRQYLTLIKITKIGGSDEKEEKEEKEPSGVIQEPDKAGGPKRESRVVRKRTAGSKKEDKRLKEGEAEG